MLPRAQRQPCHGQSRLLPLRQVAGRQHRFRRSSWLRHGKHGSADHQVSGHAPVAEPPQERRRSVAPLGGVRIARPVMRSGEEALFGRAAVAARRGPSPTCRRVTCSTDLAKLSRGRVVDLSCISTGGAIVVVLVERDPANFDNGHLLSRSTQGVDIRGACVAARCRHADQQAGHCVERQPPGCPTPPNARGSRARRACR